MKNILIALALSLICHNSIAEEKKRKSKPASDKIILESYIVGDKEQPSVSYFVPWQGVGTPQNLAWNIEQKHDDTLSIVDRDIIIRSINIYQDMNLEDKK